MTQIVLTNGFEGGTNGAQVTLANSGGTSGDAFDNIIWNNATANGGTANITYSSTAATRGTMGCSMVVANTINYLRHTQGTPAGARAVIGIKFLYSGAPSANTDLLRIRTASGATASTMIANTGKIMVQDAAAATVTAGASTATVSGKITAGALVSGQTYRLYGAATAGTTTSNGTLAWRLYDSTDTLIDSWTSSAQNAGTVNPSVARYYGPTTWGAANYLFDEATFATSDDPTFWLSLPSASTPVISVSVTQGLIDASASTGDTLSFSITQLTGTSTTAKNLGNGYFFVPQGTGSTTWRVTITQGDGQSAFADVTVAAAGISGALRYYNGTTWVTM